MSLRLSLVMLMVSMLVPFLAKAQSRRVADADSMAYILPEVLFESRKRPVLHLLAYVREYSTLSSYRDTVTMFREKMVDFMIAGPGQGSFKGWTTPRTLSSRSYYRFTDAAGRDSVSDRFNNHFSWSDWVGILPEVPLPRPLSGPVTATDTIGGRYRAAEIWRRDGDRVSVDINLMADSAARRWVPSLASFFTKEDTEFERFSLHLNYCNVVTDRLSAPDLADYSFEIESRGRGRGMFRFNRHDEPFYVTTTSVYILEKDYITVKEARKWEKRKIDPSMTAIIEPADAPDIAPDALALISRVDNIDVDSIRIIQPLDARQLANAYRKRDGKYGFGTRVLWLLKGLTGVSRYRFDRNMSRSWRDFTNERHHRGEP